MYVFIVILGSTFVHLFSFMYSFREGGEENTNPMWVIKSEIPHHWRYLAVQVIDKNVDSPSSHPWWHWRVYILAIHNCILTTVLRLYYVIIWHLVPSICYNIYNVAHPRVYAHMYINVWIICTCIMAQHLFITHLYTLNHVYNIYICVCVIYVYRYVVLVVKCTS